MGPFILRIRKKTKKGRINLRWHWLQYQYWKAGQEQREQRQMNSTLPILDAAYRDGAIGLPYQYRYGGASRKAEEG